VTALTTEPEPLALGVSRRRAAVLVAAGVLLVASAALVIPTFADLPATWERIVTGDARWLWAALAFKAVSFLGHVLLFRGVAGRGARERVGLRASTEITLAGHAATRLFAAGGAGGVVLTAWALRRAGLERGEVAARMTAFLVLLYSVYMVALVAGGLGLWLGVLPGSAPAGLTLVPAILGALVIAAALLLPRLGRGRLAPVGQGVRDALRLARRPTAALAGALLWWAGDIAVLWACFEAFGEAPAIAVLVVAYYVGMLANTLPLPGGVGGVDGGMVAALAGFGVEPGLAVVAVLAYRGFSFWLPILPGAIAWITLRRTVARWAAAPAPAALTVMDADAASLTPCPASTPSATSACLLPSSRLSSPQPACAA
jgi:uncharacterized membrane protein YbhN (UPF0104 family)